MRAFVVVVCTFAALASAARVQGEQQRTLAWFGGRFSPQLDEKLSHVETLVVQAMDAAQEAGDVEEANLQQEVLDEIDASAEKVVGANDMADQYLDAAERAADYGRFSEASEDEELAYQAESSLRDAQEELQEMLSRAEELATMSLYERMNPGTLVSAATKASPNDLAKALGASVSVSRGVVHKHLTTAFGQSPNLVWVLELVTLILPTITLAAVYAVLRREAQGPFNIRSELILFGNLYWGGYYFILTMATLISRKEPPLAVFAYSYPEQYAHYQVCVSLLFVCYLWTLARHLYMRI